MIYKRPRPETDTPLEQRAKLRRLMEEPTCRKSSTESEKTEPKRPRPSTETPLEQDAKDRRLKVLPIVRKSSTCTKLITSNLIRKDYVLLST